jgi:phosphatidylglycerol:prolipoprotein diacylglycerol transferase
MFPTDLIAYYFLISIDCVILLFWLVKRARQKQVSTQNALDIMFVLMVGALIGSRLFHVFYEEPQLYRSDFLRIFQLWYGGFVFYGGLISATVFGVFWVKYKKLDLLSWMDFFAPMGSFAYAFGRLSCVLAGCCYGKEATDLSWAMADHALQDGLLRHPTQWYAVMWETMVLLLLLGFEKKRFLEKGSLFFIWIFMHASGRLVMENFRDDPRGGMLLDLSIATWISGLLILVSLVFFLIKQLRQR